MFRECAAITGMLLVLVPNIPLKAQITDSVFSAIPLERWAAETESNPPKFRWTARVLPAELSNHQRLKAKVEIQVDGAELVSRRGHGKLLLLVQIKDAANLIYQTHQPFPLDEVKDDAARSNFFYVQEAFVKPGDYQVICGLLDTKTGDHAVTQRPLHVNPLKNDPLPNLWADLPAVDFIRESKPPDDSLLPYLKGRLRLPVEPRRALQVEVLVNLSGGALPPPLSLVPPPLGRLPNRPKIPTAGASQRLDNIVAAMKVLSQLDLRDSSLHLTMLDVSKRKVVFEQNLAAGMDLDWSLVREGLEAADPNKIDVKALAGRNQNAQFFMDEVRSRLQAAKGGGTRVLVVLSAPMTVEGGKKNPLQSAAGATVFYLRYHTLPPPPTLAQLEGNQEAFGRVTDYMPATTEPFDTLMAVLKPLQPRSFDVFTPDHFRKALASLLEELGKL